MKAIPSWNLRQRRCASLFWASLGLALLAQAQTNVPERVMLSGSIVQVPAQMLTTPVPQSRSGAAATSPANPGSRTSMEIEVSLKMRNVAELQQRVAQGERVPRQEMAEKYYPLESDYDAVIAWLEAQGLTVTQTYPNHLSVFVAGSATQISQALQVSFARVTADGQDYTSAITPPSLPAMIAPAVLGIGGLQPHLRMHPPRHVLPSTPQALKTFASPYVPKDIRQAYGVNPVVGVTRARQTIGIVMSAYPSNTDLTAFWTDCGIKQSLNNLTKIPVAGGPPAHPDIDAQVEVALDVQWSSAMAPGAKIRVYGIPDLFPSTISKAYQKIISDVNTQAGMRQVSLSFGGGEHSIYSLDEIRSEGQILLALANEGVTIFASAGDGGSRPSEGVGPFSSSAEIEVEYPASDPNVTSVGGTKLVLNASNGSVVSETVWPGTGGGVSEVFTRPSWQAGVGVPGGNFRYLPDIAGPADPKKGAFVIFRGTSTAIGGTSWSAPLLAGLCALINQARADTGQDSLGLLGPSIYPLMGSSAFRDITSGSNGDFHAAVGYDECTGVGVPVFANLFAALTNVPAQSPSTSLAFSGNAGYAISEYLGSSITLTTQELINSSSTNPTSWFFLQLWATASPYNGGALNGTLLGQSMNLAPLPPGGEYPGLQLTVPFTRPAAGTYHLTMVVQEYINGAYRLAPGAYSNLPDLVTTGQITGQPTDVSLLEGQSANLTVTAIGSPMPAFYQWQVSMDGGTSWSLLTENSTYSGVAEATLTVSNATLDMFGQEYRCLVSNGFSSLTSSAATLTVYTGDTAVAIAQAPQSQVVIVGQDALFHAGIQGYPQPDYQWQRQAAGAGSWTNLQDGGAFSGTTSSTLLISGTTAGMSGDHFRVVATNAVNTLASAAATLTTVTPPKISTQPVSAVAAQNSTAKFTVKASGTAPFKYLWRKNNVALKNSATISGANSATLVLKKVSTANSGSYSVVVSNAGGKATSKPAKLTVK